ncbi:hypothetical protein G7077_08160 [Sphingomonas piscis]|uniref:Lipoprotein n=1 Tax=Sphingomonas piscis TaxID=2714943 RepID=A0A6G7YQ54_9SPHN|nr:hypothetical protein [Sphingomonas piscis]QIK78872.1 hypothetical protein G7077_08160 [Sphingomonas piscis]
MRSLAFVTAVALLAGACGPSQQQEETVNGTLVQSKGQQELAALNDYNRAIGLKRAIHGSGKQCQRIDRSAFVQRYGTLDMWAVSCNNGRGFALFIGKDDTVQVRDCRGLAEIKLPRCPAWAENAKVTR